jgi:hypothetical protein
VPVCSRKESDEERFKHRVGAVHGEELNEDQETRAGFVWNEAIKLRVVPAGHRVRIDVKYDHGGRESSREARNADRHYRSCAPMATEDDVRLQCSSKSRLKCDLDDFADDHLDERVERSTCDLLRAGGDAHRIDARLGER